MAFSGKVTIPARVSPTDKTLRVSWTGARPGTPGQFTSAKLKFSAHLIAALRKPGVALPVRITVTATNVAGLKTTKKLTLKVK